MANIIECTVDSVTLIIPKTISNSVIENDLTVSNCDLIKVLGIGNSITQLAISVDNVTLMQANTSSGGGSGVVYYKMCARSLDNTSWETWLVNSTPDFTGTRYGGSTPINTATIYILATI